MAIEGRWINFLLGLPKIHSIIWIVNILFRLYTMVHAIIYTNIYIYYYIYTILYTIIYTILYTVNDWSYAILIQQIKYY